MWRLSVYFLSLSQSLLSLLRIVARTQSTAGLWWDDYLLFVGMVRVAREHRLPMEVASPTRNG